MRATRAAFSWCVLTTLFAPLGGCTLRTTGVLPRSAVRGVVPENRVGISTLSSAESRLLGVPAEATLSEASLVYASERELCADVLLRTWSGADAQWEVEVRADGALRGEGQWAPRECRDGGCLPEDRRVFSRATDGDPRVSVRGGRVCTPWTNGAPGAERELVVALRQGALRIEFRWELTGEVGQRVALR